MNHPCGNVTGISWFDTELGPKQLQLLSELVPNVTVAVLIVNPQSPEVADQRDTAQRAARALGWELHVIAASSGSEIDAAFTAAKRQAANALIISSDPFLYSRRKQIVALAAHHAIPTIIGGREWVASGGLISYGNSVADAYRRAGLQTGRLLRGVKPTDLPVDRSTKFELAINLTTAPRRLGSACQTPESITHLGLDWTGRLGRRDSNLCIWKSDLLNFIPPQGT